MVVSSRSGTARVPHEVVWHDLECGSYDADLALWLELAARARGPVLDIAAGTGRVTSVLARAGHHVTALERDRALLHALGERVRELPVECVLADAREFSLARRDFALCVVPMHSVQLFGGEDARAAFLRCAHAHLRPRGTLAAAILPDAEPFDCELGHIGPTPESTCVNAMRFVSTPTRVAVEQDAIIIERERRVRALARAQSSRTEREWHRDELARLTSDQLHAEAIAAGFQRESTRVVPETREHVGGEVVIARA
jgi:SAM-dependent methyltransferase